MKVGKRYLYVNNENTTFTGDVVNVTDIAVTIRNRSCESHKNSSGAFHMPHDHIRWTFPLENLIKGQRYIFTINDDSHTCEGVLVDIIGRHDTVRLKTDNGSITAFSIYCVKKIHCF
jgi:hypothetical protein